MSKGLNETLTIPINNKENAGTLPTRMFDTHLRALNTGMISLAKNMGHMQGYISEIRTLGDRLTMLESMIAEIYQMVAQNVKPVLTDEIKPSDIEVIETIAAEILPVNVTTVEAVTTVEDVSIVESEPINVPTVESVTTVESEPTTEVLPVDIPIVEDVSIIESEPEIKNLDLTKPDIIQVESNQEDSTNIIPEIKHQEIDLIVENMITDVDTMQVEPVDVIPLEPEIKNLETVKVITEGIETEKTQLQPKPTTTKKRARKTKKESVILSQAAVETISSIKQKSSKRSNKK